MPSSHILFFPSDRSQQITIYADGRSPSSGPGQSGRAPAQAMQGKSFLHYNRFDSMDEVFEQIQEVTAESIWQVANELFDPDRLFTLMYD